MGKRVFTKKDFESGDGMLTQVWGPALWHSLHTISFNYPVHPTAQQKKDYKEFLLSLANVLPCRACRENLARNYESLPITASDLKDRSSFSKYVYRLHERVNKLLGKKSGLSYSDVRNRYEHFRARCTQEVRSSETGCVKAEHGKKTRCLLRIVPTTDSCQTLVIDRKCNFGTKKNRKGTRKARNNLKNPIN